MRRHHNNTGYRQIARGKTREQVRQIAQRLGVPYGSDDDSVIPSPSSVTVDDARVVLFDADDRPLIREIGFRSGK